VLIHDTDPAAILLQCQVNLLQLLLQALQAFQETSKGTVDSRQAASHDSHFAWLACPMQRLRQHPTYPDLCIKCAVLSVCEWRKVRRLILSCSIICGAGVCQSKCQGISHLLCQRTAELLCTLRQLILLLVLHGCKFIYTVLVLVYNFLASFALLSGNVVRDVFCRMQASSAWLADVVCSLFNRFNVKLLAVTEPPGVLSSIQNPWSK
jgi:hypothetical protein